MVAWPYFKCCRLDGHHRHQGNAGGGALADLDLALRDHPVDRGADHGALQVDPGLVDIRRWRPDPGGADATLPDAAVYGAVARLNAPDRRA